MYENFLINNSIDYGEKLFSCKWKMLDNVNEYMKKRELDFQYIAFPAHIICNEKGYEISEVR